ncbi:MAG: hypothetical protein K2H07_07280 [Lachnospiraceae bacterium]|nr:hypothetical protein [Lachnospiraceae bacterium]
MKKIIIEKISILLIGIVLVIGVILTGNYSLSAEDKECYESAVKLQENIDKIGFKDFKLTDYPIAFCDGKHDYVMIPSDSSYCIQKRKPVLDTFAATVYEVNGHYEVIVPTKELMSSFMGVAGDSEYNQNEQVATIWHESFHCWQFDNFEDNISGLKGGHDFDEEGYGEELIVKECDENDKAVDLYKEETELLKKATMQNDKEEIRRLMLQYKDIQEKRNALLDEMVQKLEDYYTSVEGSACYIEAMCCKYNDIERFESYYMENINLYIKGSSKYYYSGMAQCMILDNLDSTWKASYDFSQPLINVIYEKLGI